MSLFKKVSVMAMAFAMVMGMAACGSSDAGSADKAEAEEAPAETKNYIIATDTTFAPFEFQNDAGEYVGIDLDLLAAIAEDQGFTYELNPLGFTAATQALEAGQADGVIAGMSITEERQEKFDFSEPYFDSGVVMAIAKDNEDIKSYDDLSGKTVAIKTGTEGATFAESIKDQYGFTTITFDDSSAMYMDVMSGNSVACFEDYPVIGYAITQGVELKMVTDMEQGSSYGFAVGKEKNTELLEMFNTGLANLKENGKYQEILDAYIQK
ncbi:MAG: transporter substrate-binding domain-containing protein [Anaerotignum sp.]|nr:transporter substrate-binding domain-containing protein [Anaerotignum sp.]